MNKRASLFIILLLLTLAGAKAGEQHPPCATPTQQADSLPSIPESDSRHWWALLKKGELDLADPTVQYPRFMRFCVNTYNLIDNFINAQDSTYVVNPQKQWNVHLVNQNWRDAYFFNFNSSIPVTMVSEIYANAGAYLQYSSISLGYSVDLTNMLGEKPQAHKRFNFGISSARMNLEAHYWDNSGGTYVRTFGNYNQGHPVRMYFPGASQRTMGVNGYYFFNHRQFSMGAAYSASRIQRRSAGSPILGFDINRIDVTLDFTQLPPLLKPALPFEPECYRVHYNSYTMLAGYSYNWVIRRNLLFNLSLFPGLGYTHSYDDSYYGSSDLIGMSFHGSSALTYNLRNLYFTSSFKLTSNLFQTTQLSLVSAITNGELSVGFRF